MLLDKIDGRIKTAIVLSLTISIFVGLLFLIMTKKPRIKVKEYGFDESNILFWDGKIGLKKIKWSSSDGNKENKLGKFNYYTYKIIVDDFKNINVIIYNKEKKIVNFKEYK